MTSRRAVLLAFSLLLWSCTYLTPPISRPGQESALGYYQQVLQASGDERAAEYEYLQELAPQQSPVILNTKMALLLSVPEDASAGDENRALEMLRELQQGSVLSQPAYGYLQLGSIWREVLELRLQVRESNEELTRTRVRNEQLQRNIALLEEQIEALKSIETQLNRREQ